MKSRVGKAIRRIVLILILFMIITILILTTRISSLALKECCSVCLIDRKTHAFVPCGRQWRETVEPSVKWGAMGRQQGEPLV